MYQSVSVSNNITKQELDDLYLDKLNELGDKVLYNHKFSLTRKVNQIQFLRITYLLQFVRYNELTDDDFNLFYKIAL